MKKIFLFAMALLYTITVKAQVDEEMLYEYVNISGGACEEKKNDADSETILANVKDKAGFAAVSGLERLLPAKNKLNAHDFDVLVYAIIDDDLENMLMKDTSVNDNQICAEISGRIKITAIDEKMSKALAEHGTDSPVDAVVASVEDEMQHFGQADNADYKAPAIDDRGLIYVTPTTFYNGAVSDNHSKLLKHLLGESQYFYITDNKEIADFIVMPRVEKAKVDTIDENTSRLQMQIIMNVISADETEFLQEKQSRTIVFNHQETEQQNAQKLLKTLFAKSAKHIQTELEKFYSRRNSVQSDTDI